MNWKAILKFLISAFVRQGKAKGYIDADAQKAPTIPTKEG